jgi:acrylyl-CoA reductase (NADPH)
MHVRQDLWNRMATDLKPSTLSEIIQKEITLEELPETLPTILKGQARGRIIVKIPERLERMLNMIPGVVDDFLS